MVAYFQQRQQGFTLIEVLVVITIIGLLASTVLVSVSSARATARDSQRIQSIKQIELALEVYRSTYGSYPSTGGQWYGGTTGCYTTHGLGANGYIPGLAPQFMPVLPLDPRPQIGGTDRCLLYRSNGTDFKVLLHRTMESCSPGSCPLQDPARPTQNSSAVGSPGGIGWF